MSAPTIETCRLTQPLFKNPLIWRRKEACEYSLNKIQQVLTTLSYLRCLRYRQHNKPFTTAPVGHTSKILSRVPKYKFLIPKENPKDAGMAIKMTMKAKQQSKIISHVSAILNFCKFEYPLTSFLTCVCVRLPTILLVLGQSTFKEQRYSVTSADLHLLKHRYVGKLFDPVNEVDTLQKSYNFIASRGNMRSPRRRLV